MGVDAVVSNGAQSSIEPEDAYVRAVEVTLRGYFSVSSIDMMVC